MSADSPEKGTFSSLGQVVIATHVAGSGPSPRRARAIILLLAGCVALMMTGSGIILGLSLTAQFFAALAFARAFPILLIAAILAGLGDALSAPARSAFYFDITSRQHRARILGIKGSSVSLGGILGPLLLVGVSELMTPQLIFGLAGATLVVAVLLALFTLKEPRHVAVDPEDAGWQVANRRALAAQAALRGIVLQAATARKVRGT